MSDNSKGTSDKSPVIIATPKEDQNNLALEDMTEAQVTENLTAVRLSPAPSSIPLKPSSLTKSSPLTGARLPEGNQTSPIIPQSASASHLPDPNRSTPGQSRNYNLNLSQADLEAAIVSDVQAEIERRKSERAFKYIMIVAVIVLMLMISVLMVGWEFGYFSSDQSYSAPIYY